MKRYNGYKYYFGANGNAVRGGQRINNVVYVFDEKGRLFEKKENRFVKSGSNRYHISTKHGRATIGYFIIKTIYIMQTLKEDCIKTIQTKRSTLFHQFGAARKDYNALLKMRVMKIVASIQTQV